jgi:hypothetical protein
MKKLGKKLKLSSETLYRMEQPRELRRAVGNTNADACTTYDSTAPGPACASNWPNCDTAVWSCECGSTSCGPACAGHRCV